MLQDDLAYLVFADSVLFGDREERVRWASPPAGALVLGGVCGLAAAAGGFAVRLRGGWLGSVGPALPVRSLVWATLPLVVGRGAGCPRRRPPPLGAVGARAALFAGRG